MPVARHLVPLGLSILICAIATASPAAAAATSSISPSDRTAEAQGHAFARQLCSGCHAVERTGSSPRRHAPRFAALAGQYVPLTLHRKLTEIYETGHFDMPPLYVHTEEVEDITAYINSLVRR